MNLKIIAKTLVASAFISTVVLIPKVEAYTLIGGKYASGNITYTYYGSGSYNLAALQGAQAWDNAGTNNVNLTWSNTVSTANIIFRQDDYGNLNWNARCANKPVHSSGTYTKSDIDFNEHWMDSMTASQRQGVSAHEVGHALGLDHVTTTNQVMCTAQDGRAVNKPGTDDINGANHLY
jgi:predicted Zn-dependent protease